MGRDITQEYLSAMKTPIGDVYEWIDEMADTAEKVGDKIEAAKNLHRLTVLSDLIDIILLYKKEDIEWTPRKKNADDLFK